MYSFSPLERIKKEFDNLYKAPVATLGLTVGLFNENNIRHWRLTLCPPKDSSYAGGFFSLSVFFPPAYPTVPPIICFLTPIYHLNVNPIANNPERIPLGYVNIVPLKFWNINCTMKELLIHIYSLFYYSDPECAYGFERLIEFKNLRAVYEEKAKHFAKKFAKLTTYDNFNNRNEDWDFSL